MKSHFPKLACFCLLHSLTAFCADPLYQCIDKPELYTPHFLREIRALSQQPLCIRGSAIYESKKLVARIPDYSRIRQSYLFLSEAGDSLSIQRHQVTALHYRLQLAHPPGPPLSGTAELNPGILFAMETGIDPRTEELIPMIHFYTVADQNPELSLYVGYDSQHHLLARIVLTQADNSSEERTIYFRPAAPHNYIGTQADFPQKSAPLGSLNDSVLLGFGWLTTGIPSDSVFQYLGRPDSNLIFHMSGFEFAYQAEARYLQKGMTIGFTSADTNETAVVRNFWLRKPCSLQTAFGIGVGSHVDSLKFFLGKLIHAEHHYKIWIGNDYDASVFFYSNHRIDSIFVGQIAE